MKYASLTERISGESVDTWAVHYEGLARLNAGEDIYLLSVGQESDTHSPADTVQAGIKSIENGRHHYTGTRGELSLRQAIASHQGKRFNKPIDPDCVTVFSGAQNALFATAQLLLQTGDEVILIEPYYTTYPATVTASGATLVSVVTLPEHRFQIDIAQIIAAITPNTRVIWINTPNNPSGVIYPKDILQDLVNLCREKSIWLVSDEVYMDIVDHPDICRPYSLPGAEEVTISISSVSKMYRMTGWRVGWSIGPKDLATHYYRFNTCMSYGLPAFTQDAAAYALAHDNKTPRIVCETLARQRAVVIEELEKVQKIEIYREGGGMFVMVNIRALGIDSMEFAKGLLQAEQVTVQPCNGFGQSCYGLIRISVVLGEDRMREACRRIRRYIEAFA